MRKCFYALAYLLVLFISPSISAQSPSRKITFGDIKAADFSPKVYPIDTAAQGVVLSDVGSSTYEVDTRGGFNIIFKRHTRIRLLNRNAFDEATFSIPLYAFNNLNEKIDKMEASTFNFENGQVVETKLDKNSIFQDKMSSRYIVRKFTMPNLKEGCIIDIKYTLISPYERDLKTWYFQGNLPVLYSEYECSVPAIYDFVILRQGYHPYLYENTKSVPRTFNLLYSGSAADDRTQTYTLRTELTTTAWAMENVPKLKPENFTTTLRNYVSKIDFQLSAIRYPNEPPKMIMSNWMLAAEQLLKRENFGDNLTKNIVWYADELKTIVGNKNIDREAAKKIFNYVRDNTTCNDHDAMFTQNPLKKVYQSKAGNVAEINLLLTALLMNQGFEAHPVVLSTRDNGKAYEVYPVIDKFNYVVCQVIIDGESVLLDASYKKLGFGKLHSEAYNGYARIIDVNPILINLQPDSLKETKLTSVMLFNTEKAGLEGSYQSNLGYQDSYDLREALATRSTEEYFKSIKSVYPADIHISSPVFDSLKSLEDPVTVRYELKFDANDEDIVYFDPMLNEGYKENPFKAAERLYPVEMQAPINKIFVLRMDVPKGYKVDEMPKSVRVKFNGDEGMFEYIATSGDGIIQLRSVLKLNKATYEPEDYASLRDFFGFVVKKQSEQIVLKKL
jgi:hypothetical protein